MLKIDLNNIPSKYLKDNLLEHHDYEAVSKEIYKNIKKWYNVDIEIIRILKADPLNNNKLFLDLYPEKRKNLQNSFDSFIGKRSLLSDQQNLSQPPNSRQSYNNSKNFDDFNEVNEAFRQNLSKNFI